ncbi:heat shock factor protein 3-like isoform X1 [Macrotis lagotis]|uniref:heat shock factor protein 3-like isoform X1 n=1 Tax=Macrotis lagotis TaxID=92651 RepID=UPI003D698366
MEGASSVAPAFLSKLWALVEDSGTDDLIRWSQNGQSFCIFDEQNFSKELLPKYFKHNNFSSFVRQLNMYGFRKVAVMDSGMVGPEKNTVIEFQHLFFKQGEANLLENIKRKVPPGKMEEFKACSDDLQKILTEVQEIKEQQTGMDSKVESMKRSLTDVSGSPPSKYSRQCIPIPMENGEAVDVLDPGSPIVKDSSGTTFQDAPASEDDDLSGFEGPALSPTSFASPSFCADLPSLIEGEDHLSPVYVIPSFGLDLDMTDCPLQITEDSLEPEDIGDFPLDFHSSQAIDSEDPAVVIDSILNDNHLFPQGGGFLSRNEIRAFLSRIEANLEELHSMLSGKKLNPNSDLLSEIPAPEFPVVDMNETETSSNMADTLAPPESAEEGGMTSEFGAVEMEDIQLVQYMSNTLPLLFEELPSFEDKPQDDLLLADLENEEAIPTYLEDSNDPLCLVASSLSDENSLGFFQAPLLSEDSNEEYKLFPLLLLNPVTNFIDEASEIENT